MDDYEISIVMSRSLWLVVSARLGDVVNLQMRMGVNCQKTLDPLNKITVSLNEAQRAGGE